MKDTATALVTGATSGLGFETAKLLADRGYGRVIITARTQEKANRARAELAMRDERHVFETLLLDFDDLSTVEAAVVELAARGGKIDVLILNAGMAPRPEVSKTADDLEATVASTLIGHHLLTMRLVENDLVSERARIVIAGSEAARGDVPMFQPLDVNRFAIDQFGGDLEAAIEAQIRMQPPAEYKPSDTYATAKQFVVWWAAELAKALPEGATVNAVSPGSTPDTNAINNAPFYLRRIMVPLFKLIPGMSHSVTEGASRYLEVAGYDDHVTGRFFASEPKKMTGALAAIEMDHLDDPPAQRALWNVTARVSGGVGYPAHN